MRPHRNFPSSFIGTSKDTVIRRPYNKDVYETRNNRNPLVRAKPHGRGCVMLMFSDSVDSEISAYSDSINLWTNGLDDLNGWRFPSDMIGTFSITDIGLPDGVTMPQYIGFEESIPTSPTLAQFQSYYYKCRAAKQIQSQAIDVVIFVDPSSIDDPGYNTLKTAVDATGFPAWLATTGANVFKHFEGSTSAWLDAFAFYIELAHENTLKDQASNW